MRYAKLCGLIIPGVESSTLFRFYDCNMCCIFLFCKENVFTIDFWQCKGKVFSALHYYFQHYIVIYSNCFVLLCTSISMVVCVFDLLFIFRE